jgi:hypothetical protein
MIVLVSGSVIAFILLIVFLVVMLGGFARMRRNG